MISVFSAPAICSKSFSSAVSTMPDVSCAILVRFMRITFEGNVTMEISAEMIERSVGTCSPCFTAAA